MHAMLARWVPPLERSKFAAYVYAGNLPIYSFIIFLQMGMF